jgi:hypothetical protein
VGVILTEIALRKPVEPDQLRHRESLLALVELLTNRPYRSAVERCIVPRGRDTQLILRDLSEAKMGGPRMQQSLVGNTKPEGLEHVLPERVPKPLVPPLNIPALNPQVPSLPHSKLPALDPSSHRTYPWEPEKPTANETPAYPQYPWEEKKARSSQEHPSYQIHSMDEKVPQRRDVRSGRGYTRPEYPADYKFPLDQKRGAGRKILFEKLF